MPAEEILALLAADDPEVVRRYLELHRERLEERVTEERRAIDRIEQSLTEAIIERRGRAAIERAPRGTSRALRTLCGGSTIRS